MDLGFQFNNEKDEAVEVLNNVAQPSNIKMKTRLTMEQIQEISYRIYLQLCDVKGRLDEKGDLIPGTENKYRFNADECFDMAFDSIMQMMCSLDDQQNRVAKIVEGLKNMNVSKIEQAAMGAPPFK